MSGSVGEAGAAAPMRDLGTALALVLVIEGILYALVPGRDERVAARAMRCRRKRCARPAWSPLALGVVIVWLLRR